MLVEACATGTRQRERAQDVMVQQHIASAEDGQMHHGMPPATTLTDSTGFFFFSQLEGKSLFKASRNIQALRHLG